jgi:hypothetical protein
VPRGQPGASASSHLIGEALMVLVVKPNKTDEKDSAIRTACPRILHAGGSSENGRGPSRTIKRRRTRVDAVVPASGRRSASSARPHENLTRFRQQASRCSSSLNGPAIDAPSDWEYYLREGVLIRRSLRSGARARPGAPNLPGVPGNRFMSGRAVAGATFHRRWRDAASPTSGSRG